MAGGRRIRRASPIERLHDCQLCIRGFKSEANLTKHLLNHAQNCQRKVQVVKWERDQTTEISTQFVLTSFVGKKTGKFYSRLKSPTSHRKPTIEQSPGRIYECIFCKLIFSNHDDLGNHMNEHPLEASFKCTVCGYYFRTEEDLSKHITMHNQDSQHFRSHTGNKPYKCNLCDRAFVSPLRLAHHSYTHSGNWPYLCEVCGKGFARETQKLSHMNVHLDTNKVFKCKFCKESFNDRVCLLKHVKQHTDIRRYNCHLCKRSYSQEASLKTHMRSHAGQFACRCSFCGKGFFSKYDLKRHLPLHTRQRVRHVCTVCGKHCLSNKVLQRHMKLHDKPYQCQICKSGRTSKSALIRHMQEKHYDDLLQKPESINREGNANTHTVSQVAKTADQAEIMAKLLTCYQCSSCSLVYLDRDSCEKHLEMHNAKSIACDLCDESFVSETERSTHMNTAHSQFKYEGSSLFGSVGVDVNDRSSTEAATAACVLVLRAGTDNPKQLRECNVCGQMFKRNVGKMVEHLKQHTEVDWPPKCDICGQTFKTKKELPPHKATHTNDWPFKCDQCDRGFFFKSKFMRHMVIHTDEKAFKCDVCDKAFHQKPDLKKHMMKHTDLRPFQCDQCGKTFREKGHLKRHIATHSNDRSSEQPKLVKRKQTPSAEQSVPVEAQMTPSGKIFYACKVCLDAFTTKASYVKHMKTHPSEEQFEMTETQQYYYI